MTTTINNKERPVMTKIMSKVALLVASMMLLGSVSFGQMMTTTENSVYIFMSKVVFSNGVFSSGQLVASNGFLWSGGKIVASNSLLYSGGNIVLTNVQPWMDQYHQYPVFIIPLGEYYTDFEIKASVDNFANLVYYVQSSAPNFVADDTKVFTYFTDDYASDVRKWVKAIVGVSILSQLSSPNSKVDYVVFQPSHECAIPWQTWMSPTNSKLVWSYVKYDGINYETNRTGTKPHWNPIVPVEWRANRIQF